LKSNSIAIVLTAARPRPDNSKAKAKNVGFKAQAKNFGLTAKAIKA